MKQSLLAYILETARKHPDKLALVDRNRTITYGQYERMIRQEAACLRSMGVCPGSYVVMEVVQRIEYAVTLFALHLIGAVPVPLENRCGPARLQQAAKKTGACMIISVREEAYQTYEAITALFKDFEPLENVPLPKETALCEILSSTGTTGTEKGVVLTHRNEIACAENVAFGAGMLPDNIEMIPSPLNHSHGLRSFYANMLIGGSVILIDNVFDLKRFYGYLDTFHVTSIDLVPSALSVILSLSGDKLGDYKDQLRFMEFGSAPMRDEDKEALMRLLPGIPLYNFYGSTESGRTTVYNFNRPDAKPHCIGKPTLNARIVIVDENRHEISSGPEHTGKLACDGAMNMQGYDDPQQTARTMENGRIYSEDVGYIDTDGDIILLGRAGDIINIGGRKVSPEDIERAARALPEIADCACVGVPDPLSGSAARLYVVMKPGHPFDSKAIREALSTSLESYKIPKYILETDRIPRTFNGKILRKELV